MSESELYFLVLLVLAVSVPFFLYRVTKGPTLFDRLIGVSGISTKAILFLVMIGAFNGQLEMFIDLALGYALLSLVGSLAVGKYLEERGVES